MKVSRRRRTLFLPDLAEVSFSRSTVLFIAVSTALRWESDMEDNLADRGGAGDTE
jgi:hypothetical protein